MNLHQEMKELREEMEAFAERVRDIVEDCTNEEQTKISLINPYLELLGYDVRHPRQVRFEARADFPSGSERVDYEVLYDGQPRILIEAKKATASLGDDGQPTAQIQRYATSKSVQYVAYTNGRIWRWFRKDAGTGWLERKPFLEHNVTEPEDRELRWLATIHNAAFSEEAAARTAEEESLQSAFALWYRKCRDEPPESFLRLLLQEVGRSTAKEMRARAKAAWREMLAAERAELLSEASRRIRDSAQANPETAPAPAPSGARDDAETRGSTRREETTGEETTGEETPRAGLAAFRLDGQRHDSRTWPELLTKLCETLARTVGAASFTERVLPIKGTKLLYFSLLEKDIKKGPRHIPGTNLYISVSHSAAQAEKLARRILRAVRGTGNGFEIEYRE